MCEQEIHHCHYQHHTAKKVGRVPYYGINFFSNSQCWISLTLLGKFSLGRKLVVFYQQVGTFILLVVMMVTLTSTQWSATIVVPNSGVMWCQCTTVAAALPQQHVMDIFMLWEDTGHLISELLKDMILLQIHGKWCQQWAPIELILVLEFWMDVFMLLVRLIFDM